MANSSFAHRVRCLIRNSRLQLGLKSEKKESKRKKGVLFLPVLEERSDSVTTSRRCFVHEFDGPFGRTGGHVLCVHVRLDAAEI